MQGGNDKKSAKKRFIWNRNKRDKLIHQHQEARKREQERIEGLEEQMAPAPSTTVSDVEIWSAKTQEIRDKLTGKKRKATERWNRFAGTSGGGAKGL